MNALSIETATLVPPPLPSAEALKQIAHEAGKKLATDTIARIQSGEITKYDGAAIGGVLSTFVFDCCDDMRTDGHGMVDVIVFRDACIRGFREVFSAYRLGLSAASDTSKDN